MEIGCIIVAGMGLKIRENWIYFSDRNGINTWVETGFINETGMGQANGVLGL